MPECDLKLTGTDISRWLTQWKRTEGNEWLKLVPATCLTQCLRDQDSAFRNFFAGRAQYPKFKRKGSAGSLRFRDAGASWKRGILTLPKLGVLKLAESLPSVDRPCKACHDRDINAARNLLMEGLRQLAACDVRDLCVDAGDACPEEILVQVLAEGDEVQFTRSGQYNRTCLEQARLH